MRREGVGKPKFRGGSPPGENRYAHRLYARLIEIHNVAKLGLHRFRNGKQLACCNKGVSVTYTVD